MGSTAKSKDSAPEPFRYVTLSAERRANLIRDRLAQLEIEHCRVALQVEAPSGATPNPGDERRLAELSAQIERLQRRLADLDVAGG